MKLREVISQLRQELNNLNPDQRYTNQFLHAELISAAKLILKREAESRKLYRSIEEFSAIECFDLEPVSLMECAGIVVPKCDTVMRSVKKIPEAYQSSTGYILNVFSLDRLVSFIPSDPITFGIISRREFKGRQKYYWIIGDYLYIPNSSISKVFILGLFLRPHEVDKLNDPDMCKKFMDADTGMPDWLIHDIVATALQRIVGVTKRIPEDSNTNLNPNN